MYCAPKSENCLSTLFSILCFPLQFSILFNVIYPHSLNFYCKETFYLRLEGFCTNFLNLWRSRQAIKQASKQAGSQQGKQADNKVSTQVGMQQSKQASRQQSKQANRQQSKQESKQFLSGNPDYGSGCFVLAVVNPCTYFFYKDAGTAERSESGWDG